MKRQAAKHVLVVDDEESVRRALKKILRTEGFDVEDAADAQEAMVLARRRPFDLVITDLVMPGPNGLALLTELRAVQPPPKVVLITAYGDWDSYIAAMSAGAFDYLTKPIKRNQIVRLVQNALDEREEPDRGAEPRPRRGPAS